MAAKPKQGTPYAPALFSAEHIGAIQALERGDAQPHQQKMALKWIIENAACLYDISFHAESDRLTTFAEGRRFVGSQIVKLAKLNAAAYKD